MLMNDPAQARRPETVTVRVVDYGSVSPLPNDGASTGSAPFPAAVVWPRRLLQPPRPPALIYLDLNHYIYLARAVARFRV